MLIVVYLFLCVHMWVFVMAVCVCVCGGGGGGGGGVVCDGCVCVTIHVHVYKTCSSSSTCICTYPELLMLKLPTLRTPLHHLHQTLQCRQWSRLGWRMWCSAWRGRWEWQSWATADSTQPDCLETQNCKWNRVTHES